MWIARCLDLYVKEGGFTHKRDEAQRFETKEAARRKCPYPWVIEKYLELAKENVHGTL